MRHTFPINRAGLKLPTFGTQLPGMPGDILFMHKCIITIFYHLNLSYTWAGLSVAYF